MLSLVHKEALLSSGETQCRISDTVKQLTTYLYYHGAHVGCSSPCTQKRRQRSLGPVDSCPSKALASFFTSILFIHPLQVSWKSLQWPSLISVRVWSPRRTKARSLICQLLLSCRTATWKRTSRHPAATKPPLQLLARMRVKERSRVSR